MPELNIIGAKEENRYFPYQQAFRVTRNSFWQAGQDSFTNPPAQNPDSFQLLFNAEPVLQGNIQRRRGYTLFSNTAPAAAFHEGFAFRSETLGIRSLVWTSSSTVVVMDEAGNIVASPLFTPTLSSSAVRMVLSRSYGYFTDGTRADYLKWNGTTTAGNLTNWGIAISAAPAAQYGPNPPGTAISAAGGFTPWSNPNNIKVADGAYASVTLTPGGPSGDSNLLQGTNFAFAVVPASSVITGVQVDIKGFQTVQNGVFTQIGAHLLKGGAVVGSGHATSLPLSNGFVTLGGPNDLWGTSLIGSDANAGNFGISIFAACTSGAPCTFNIDFVQITLFVSGGTIILGAPAGTGITLISGRVYTVVFQNSTAGTTSGLYPFSGSTGPLTNQGQPISGLPVSPDPQVDSKLLLATADGGDETTLYLITTLPNAQTTYTDIMPDSQLLTQPIYQQTDQNGNLHGVANNNQPPLIDYPTKHKGRIYGLGSVQTAGPALLSLCFSKNLDDVTTSTGTITGKWEEAWPATNSLDISLNAESGTGLLSDGQTLYIATDACIRRLIGDSPDNFQQPEVIFNETGVVNQETWKIVFMEGQPVGSMWLTPDNRVMFSDFNTYQDVGTPIQNVLNTINQSIVQTSAHACFVSQGPAEYFMLYIPTGINLIPNTTCVYNMRTKKWCVWTALDLVAASLFNINATGTPQWLFSTSAGPVYKWDNTVRQDRTGNTPASYPVVLTTPWLDFGDSGLTKAFNKVFVTTLDSALTVAIQGAIRDSDLDGGGTQIIPPTTLVPEIFGELFVPDLGSKPGYFKWYQLIFTSPSSTVTDVLDAFDMEIAPSMRM